MGNIEYEVKGNYGNGWEFLTTEPTRAEAEDRLREYDENEPEYPHKITKHKNTPKLDIWPKFGAGAGGGK